MWFNNILKETYPKNYRESSRKGCLQGWRGIVRVLEQYFQQKMTRYQVLEVLHISKENYAEVAIPTGEQSSHVF